MPRMDGFELISDCRRGQYAPGDCSHRFRQHRTPSKHATISAHIGSSKSPSNPPPCVSHRAKAASQSQLTEETERLQRQLQYQGVLADMVGTSPQMQAVFSVIRQVAPSKAAVLIVGESGTGKELVARAVHQLSPRRGGPFVAINCAAMPETHMESELFGHEKGASTGALERRAGVVSNSLKTAPCCSTNWPRALGTQAKLLRVLEDSRVRRLGGRNEISC